MVEGKRPGPGAGAAAWPACGSGGPCQLTVVWRPLPGQKGTLGGPALGEAVSRNRAFLVGLFPAGGQGAGVSGAALQGPERLSACPVPDFKSCCG